MTRKAKTSDGPRRQRIGKFEVIEHIATGGMGAVYRALDTELDRPVALKVLAPDLASNDVALERFRREARSAAQLRHENIVAVYDVGEDNGTHFLALEFVEGIDLQQYVAERGKLAPEEARQILIQAARALEHAHSRGIVHRDIKPSNFLIGEVNGKPRLRLTDMGLARILREDNFRLTNPGSTVGTVDYMSPEQARDSSSADIRSDIYSLGCTFFHLLAGSAPFAKGNLGERLLQHFESPPPDIRTLNPQVPPALVVILNKMLEKKPRDRYQTPSELLFDLEHPDKVRTSLLKENTLASLRTLAADEAPAAVALTERRPVKRSDSTGAGRTPVRPNSRGRRPAQVASKQTKCRTETDVDIPAAAPTPSPEREAHLESNGSSWLDNWHWTAATAAGIIALLMILLQIFHR